MSWKRWLPMALAALVVVGCSGNPTNEPSVKEIQDANARRAAAIDSDTSLTEEGKAKMKEMLKLDGGSKNR